MSVPASESAAPAAPRSAPAEPAAAPVRSRKAAAEPVSEPVSKPEPKPEPKPKPVAESAPMPVREPESASAPSELNAAAVRTMWPTVREKVRQRSRTTEVMLAGATVRAVDDNTLVLTHSSAPLAKRLSEQRNADVIAEALKDALGVNWRVRCEAGAAAPAPEAPPPAREEAPTNEPADGDSTQDADSTQRDEEEHMLAEAGRSEPSAPRRDPEEVALELLQNELGARRIDGG
jgi:DNA polymerase-3 subunit gamma/tau